MRDFARSVPRQRVVVPGELMGIQTRVAARVHMDDRGVEPADLVEQAVPDLL